jgi:hypothetical protein
MSQQRYTQEQYLEMWRGTLDEAPKPRQVAYDNYRGRSNRGQQEADRLFNEGLSVERVVVRMGLSEQTVVDYFRKWVVITETAKHELHLEDLAEQYAVLREKRFTLTEAAATLKIHPIFARQLAKIWRRHLAGK